MGRECNTNGRETTVYKILVRKLKGREHVGDSGVYGRIILKWI
jgi:hypothetical protein